MAEWLKTARHVPQNTPCGIFHGPKYSTCQTVAMEIQLDPVGMSHKGVWPFFGLFWPFLPLREPIGAILGGEVAIQSRLQGR